MKLRKIKEGKVVISVPDAEKYDSPVFYNEDAEFVRDINVSVLSVVQKRLDRKIELLDALSASGISGIRYKKENKHVKITLNDRNKEAIKLIKKNLKQNKTVAKVYNKDANLLMRENLFDYIDIDPFGSPCVFMDSISHAAKYSGFVAITATDTGALAGSFSNACLRKYGIRATRKPYYPETGLRVLVTFIMNSLARYDKTFRPVMFLAHKHYYRIYGFIGGTKLMSSQLKQYKDVDGIGTIYMGPIKDNEFIKEVISELEKRKFKQSRTEIRFLEKITQENDEPFYYDINKMGLIKVDKTEDVIFKLIQKGYKASRTSLCGSGIKTNAKLKNKNGLLIIEK